jgi:hypothetical protein
MKKTLFYVLISYIILLLFAGEIALLSYYGRGTWLNRLSFVLEIIGFYGIGLGLVQGSDLLKEFDGMDEMTSPDPVRFLRGNFLFLSVLSSFAAVALGSKRLRKSSMALGCLGQIVVMSTFPFLLVYFLVHLLVLCPFAYIGYLFTSALVESVAGSSEDIGYVSTAPGRRPQKMSVREIIASNPSAAKSFLIGVPALLLSFISNAIGMFLG